MTPITAKCLCCNETHRFTRYREFWQCSCENGAMYDTGDGHYSRMGAKDPKKIVTWRDNEPPRVNQEMVDYLISRDDPHFFDKVMIKRIEDRLLELKANARVIQNERKQLLEQRKNLRLRLKK